MLTIYGLVIPDGICPSKYLLRGSLSVVVSSIRLCKRLYWHRIYCPVLMCRSFNMIIPRLGKVGIVETDHAQCELHSSRPK